MAHISPTIPTIGQPNSTEDQDIVNALTAIVAAINGGLDTTNLAASAGITAAQLTTAIRAAAGLNGATTRRGACHVATEETRTNTAYGTLTTPDQVASIVLPTNGLIFVAYKATWKGSVASAARAAIFLGSTQLQSPATGGAIAAVDCNIPSGGPNVYTLLTTAPSGLMSATVGPGSTDVTTGQTVSNFYDAGADWNYGGTCAIFAAAGTYDVSVRFKATSGDVVAKDRKLWVWSMGFD